MEKKRMNIKENKEHCAWAKFPSLGPSPPTPFRPRQPSRCLRADRWGRGVSLPICAGARLTLTELWAHLSVSPATTSSPMAELRRKLREIPLPAKPHGLRPYLIYRASGISSPNPSPRNLTSAAAVGSEGEGIAAQS